jgi:hypothetical protein
LELEASEVPSVMVEAAEDAYRPEVRYPPYFKASMAAVPI